MGTRTDPAFDHDILEPLVAAHNAARRRGDPPTALARREQAIKEALEPEVRRVYGATQRAIALLREMGLPPLPDLEAMEEREAAAFASFMASRDAGYPLPLRDKARPAVFKLTEREDARENTGAAVTLGDRVARARGRLSGRVLRGTVADVQEVPDRPAPGRAPPGPGQRPAGAARAAPGRPVLGGRPPPAPHRAGRAPRGAHLPAHPHRRRRDARRRGAPRRGHPGTGPGRPGVGAPLADPEAPERAPAGDPLDARRRPRPRRRPSPPAPPTPPADPLALVEALR